MFWEHRLYDPTSDSKRLLFDYDCDSDNLLICKDNDGIRKFTMFENLEEFYTFQSKIPTNERCFYEIIMKDKWRKPYFDIDISVEDNKDLSRDDTDDMLETLTFNIENELKNYDIKIIVATSHTTTKHSYHVIVDGVKLRNPSECSNFARLVVPPKLKNFVDTSVYKPTQQFRILGSRKSNKNNKKIIDYGLSKNFFVPSGHEKDYYNTQSCMITFTDNCREYATIQQLLNAKTVVMDDFIEDAIEMIEKIYHSVFKVRNVKELDKVNYIEMQSSGPYYCKIHKRMHDSENAFVKIKHLVTHRKVFFDCRRIEDHEKLRLRPLYLGSIHIQREKKIDIDFCVNKDVNIIKRRVNPILGLTNFKLFK